MFCFYSTQGDFKCEQNEASKQGYDAAKIPIPPVSSLSVSSPSVRRATPPTTTKESAERFTFNSTSLPPGSYVGVCNNCYYNRDQSSLRCDCVNPTTQTHVTSTINKNSCTGILTDINVDEQGFLACTTPPTTI